MVAIGPLQQTTACLTFVPSTLVHSDECNTICWGNIAHQYTVLLLFCQTLKEASTYAYKYLYKFNIYACICFPYLCIHYFRSQLGLQAKKELCFLGARIHEDGCMDGCQAPPLRTPVEAFDFVFNLPATPQVQHLPTAWCFDINNVLQLRFSIQHLYLLMGDVCLHGRV